MIAGVICDDCLGPDEVLAIMVVGLVLIIIVLAWFNLPRR